MTLNKSNTLESTHIRFGSRTYFFDVKQGVGEKKYLKITESKFMGEGADRKYNSFLLFPEDIDGFKKSFEEMAGSLS
jgi:hypothetical protein